MRLAGKARLARKLKRTKQRKEQHNPRIKVKEENRDKKANQYAAALKKKKIQQNKQNKQNKQNTPNTPNTQPHDDTKDHGKEEHPLPDARVLLPIIRVGFICESMDPYMYNISSPLSQQIRLLLKSTVARHHVTLYIPQWAMNHRKTQAMKRYFTHHVLPELMDDNAVFTRASELAVQNMSSMGTKYKHIFTMQILPRHQQRGKSVQSSVVIPRVDVLVFVAPVLDSTAHYLAHTRLAPIQVGYWGGTGTSGLGQAVGQLDYFVTSGMVHRSEGHRSYTEQMVRDIGIC